MKIVLAPHNDDEALFCAYQCLRHKPLVIVCLRSFIEATWPGPTWQQREPETKAATQILGCQYQQLPHSDSSPPWKWVRDDLKQLGQPDHVWAPLPEPDGHPHHNAVGEIAYDLFDNLTFYATYTRNNGNAQKSTIGMKVEPEPGWPLIK